MDRARSDDPVLTDLRLILPVLHEITRHHPMTAGEIKTAMGILGFDDERANAVRGIAEGRHGDVDTNKLGRYFARYEGRIVGDLKLSSSFNSHAKQKAWQVVRV